jgi:hypothetical protein
MQHPDGRIFRPKRANRLALRALFPEVWLPTQSDLASL